VISNQQFQVTDYKSSVITDFKAGLVSINNQEFQIIDFKAGICKVNTNYRKHLETPGNSQNLTEESRPRQ
jgi:hypothetical protein